MFQYLINYYILFYIKYNLIVIIDEKQLCQGIYTRDRLCLLYLKIIIIIIATLISCSNQTTLAEYSFPNISTTTVLSSVSPSTQPQIKFPSKLLLKIIINKRVLYFHLNILLQISFIWEINENFRNNIKFCNAIFRMNFYWIYTFNYDKFLKYYFANVSIWI